MKKLPIFATIVLVVGVLASLGFTHAISSQNGVVRDYSPGATLTLDTASGPHTYILRGSTLMWGWGATSFVANTGGNGTTSSSSSSSGSSTSVSPTTNPSGTTATATPNSSGATATATPSTSGSGSSSGGTNSSATTTGAASSVNGLGAGARVTVFAECFPGTMFRHMNSSRLTGNGNSASGDNNVCLALAVIVRTPMSGAIAATGGNGANATTETPTALATETPAVTMTPTP